MMHESPKYFGIMILWELEFKINICHSDSDHQAPLAQVKMHQCLLDPQCQELSYLSCKPACK